MSRNVFTEADYSDVRGRVLGEIRRQGRVRAAVYAAAAAAVTVVAFGLWAWRTAQVEPMPVVARAVAPQPIVTETAPPPRLLRVHHRAHRPKLRLEEQPKQEEPAETLLVKLETPDPDVVIYWIVEGKGDSE